MFSWFSWKKEDEKIKEDTKNGFESVKKDISSLTGWIKHLDSEKNLQKKEIDLLKGDLSSIKEEVDGIKNVLSLMNDLKPKQLFKTTTNSCLIIKTPSTFLTNSCLSFIFIKITLVNKFKKLRG